MITTHTISGEEQRTILEHAELFGMNSTLIRILYARGYDTTEKIDQFLHPCLSDLYSPFLMSGMFTAVERIKTAVNSGERIGIFADSDIDGITALAVLHKLFIKMKIEPFIRYLKDEETYGLTREIINEFHGNNVSLLITVDSGIRDIAEIAFARSLGIDVVVSDHHEQDTMLPDAIIINPKTEACRYPFKHLAGVGIAFKVCHAFLLSYLPSFNKLFLIITRENGRYYASAVRNCIIEQTRSEADEEQITSTLASMTDIDAILIHNIDDPDAIFKSLAGSAPVYDFCGFINGILKSGNASLDGICSKLDIKKKFQNKNIELLTAVFFETQMIVPDKIHEFIRSVIGLVSIGSIADVMPLIDENRILAKIGIEELNKSRQPALSMLIGDGKINYKTIGWGIAPLLNTPGRLGKTDLTVNFFIESDVKKLQSIIREIGLLNNDRKSTINKLYTKIMNDLEGSSTIANNKLIYIKTNEIPDGYAGLIANRIAETTDKPVIIVVLPGKNGIIKGSGRIKNGLNFFSHVKQFKERFERVGGHEKAFGFTAKAHQIDDIIRSIAESFKDNHSAGITTAIDSELEVKQINVDFIRELEILEPFGNGNAEPMFLSRSVSLESCTVFGNNHGKYLFSGNASLSAIGWGLGSIMKDFFKSGRPLDLIYRLENNVYNGYVQPRMIVVDIQYS